MSGRVLITGVGAVTPLGVGASELYEGWTAGRTGIEDGLGACNEFDPTDFMTVKEVRRSDRFAQLAIAASTQAVADAGWDDDDLPTDPADIGCVIGSGIGGMWTFESQCDVLRERGPERVSPLAIPLIMGNAAAGLVAMRHHLGGPVFGVMSACASGTHAIGEAMRMIRTERHRRSSRAEPRLRSLRSRRLLLARWTRPRRPGSRGRSTPGETGS